MACRRLVTIANESGGEDNITVVVSNPIIRTMAGDSDEFDTVVPDSESLKSDYSTTVSEPLPPEEDDSLDTDTGGL